MENKEQYVCLETAKMLKIVGFGWDVKTYYIPDLGDKVHEDSWYPEWYDKENEDPFMKETIPAPTQAVAMRWLREVEKIMINVDYLEDATGWGFSVHWYQTTKKIKDHYSTLNLVFPPHIEQTKFPTYEEAMEAGIKDALNKLIKENNDA